MLIKKSLLRTLLLGIMVTLSISYTASLHAEARRASELRECLSYLYECNDYYLNMLDFKSDKIKLKNDTKEGREAIVKRGYILRDDIHAASPFNPFKYEDRVAALKMKSSTDKTLYDDDYTCWEYIEKTKELSRLIEREIESIRPWKWRGIQIARAALRGAVKLADGAGNLADRAAKAMFESEINKVTNQIEANKKLLVEMRQFLSNSSSSTTTFYHEKLNRVLLSNNEGDKKILEAEIPSLEREIAKDEKQLEKLQENMLKFKTQTAETLLSSGQKYIDSKIQIEQIMAENKGKIEIAEKESTIKWDAITKMLRDPQQLARFTVTAGAASLLITSGYYLSKLAYTKARAYFMQPSLITKSSIGMMGFRKKTPPSQMGKFVAGPQLKGKIESIIRKVRNALKTGGTLMNIAFYGPPGTGKTFIAEEIAIQSGMDYAIFSAGDFEALNAQDRALRLREIFDWAEALAKRGRKLIIFVDEADQFLLDRRLAQPSQIALQTIFLNRVPERRSPNFMFIFATNFYEKFDEAVFSRIDDAIGFELPDQAARYKIFLTYLDIYVKRKGYRITKEDEEKIAHTFSQDEYTKGMSGRVLDGFVASLGDEAAEFGKLTYHMAEPIIIEKVQQEKFKQEIEQQKQREMGLKPLTAGSVSVPVAAK